MEVIGSGGGGLWGGERGELNDGGEGWEERRKRIEDDFDFIEVDRRKRGWGLIGGEGVDVRGERGVMEDVGGGEEENGDDGEWGG